VVGTIEQYPNKALALRASEHLRLTANHDNPTARTLRFGALLGRYLAEELPARHSTSLAYRSYIETHIRPKWADYSLNEMVARGAAFTIEGWLNSLSLAPKTKGNIRNVMSIIFGCAMRWGLIEMQRNPLSLVRVKGVSRRQTEPRILTPEEIQVLMAELSVEPVRTAVIVAMATGLRCSELFALKWLDVSWHDLTLSVKRAIVDGVVGDVKTKYSSSGLPLDASLAEVMLGWQRICQFPQKGDWIFASPQKAGDLPLRASAMLEAHIKPAAQRAGLDRVGWHTFRHTYSSMLRGVGTDLKVQQELLRHADIRTTMNIYTQALSEQKRAAHSKVVRMVLPLGKNLTGRFGRLRAN
jgi:integrase